ncbi:MAG: TetR/AcrR family transcriptional regulator [Acidimicrobiia bacterium]
MIHGTDTRDRIRLEGAALFRRKGFNGTSMSELAEAVGITKSSLYHHFPSKQALLSEIIERTVRRVTPLVEDVADMHVPAAERLRLAVILHTVGAIEDRDAVACFTDEGRYLDTEYMAAHLARRDAYEAVFRRLLEEGYEAGEFVAQDFGVAVKAILGMCNSVIRWYRPDGAKTAHEIAEDFARFAVRGASVPEPAAVAR